MFKVTRTAPLELLVWVNRKDPYNERQKIPDRTEDLHSAGG